MIVVLEETLAYHRYALGLDQNNADTIFNTAQVLTSIAEEIFKDDPSSNDSAVGHLKEALELLQRCFALQEFRFTEFQHQVAEALRTSEEADRGAMPANDGHKSIGTSDPGLTQEQWVSVIEPITKDTLMDTIIAQLSTLTTLCSILGYTPQDVAAPTLAWVEDYSSELLNVRLPALLEGVDRVEEAAICKAVFISAMLEASFRADRLEVQTYRRERDTAFSQLPVPSSPAALMANAASLLAYNNALSESDHPPAATADLASMRWDALAAAINNLATASNLCDIAPENVPKTHLLRGDASLCQYQLSKPPACFAPALKNSATLLKNAEVFYRNASRLTHDDEERQKGRIQEAVVTLLEGKAEDGRTQLETITATLGDRCLRDHIDEMLAEGLLTENDVQTIGFIQ